MVTRQPVTVSNTALLLGHCILLAAWISCWKNEKKVDSLFDVTMVSYSGAEICTRVGIYVLNKVSDGMVFCDKWAFGLYRDDFIGVVRKPIREIEHGVKKKLADIFKTTKLELEGFRIGKKAIFLDAQFELKKEEYRPYRKPNDTTNYINVKSNHPKSTIRALPKNVEKRISMLSSTEAIFEECKHEYVQALRNAGYGDEESNLAYQNDDVDPEAANRRNRYVIWFTPPWSIQVRTNIWREFLKIIDETFKNTWLGKILNRSTVKISYSVTRNLKSIITGQSKKILSNNGGNDIKCNCQDRDKSPLDNNCVQKDIVYKATATSDATEKQYIGCTDNFKPRYRNHMKSVNNIAYRNDTELSTYVWSQRTNGANPQLRWSVIARARSYKSGDKQCSLCVTEKALIISCGSENDVNLINTRIDLGRTCPHRVRAKLECAPGVKWSGWSTMSTTRNEPNTLLFHQHYYYFSL